MAAGRRRVRCTTPRTSSGAISTSFSTRPTCMLVCRGCVAMSTGYTRGTPGQRLVGSSWVWIHPAVRGAAHHLRHGDASCQGGRDRPGTRHPCLASDREPRGPRARPPGNTTPVAGESSRPTWPESEIAREHDTRVWRVIENHVARERAKLDFAEVREVGLDETSAAKGQDYITIFMDLLLRRVLFAIEGRDGSTVKAFAADLVAHGGDPELITRTSSDMSNAIIAGVGDNLPNAEMTFDRFHIMKLLSEAVDDVRRVEQRDNTLLKKTRYIWLKNEPNLTAKQKETRAWLTRPSMRLATARALRWREDFQAFYDQPQQAAEAYLRHWCYGAKRSRLEPLKHFVKSVEEHWDGIISWHASRISNGLLEGTNSLIQAAKARARGYRSKRKMIAITYLIAGKLPTPSPFVTHTM